LAGQCRALEGLALKFSPSPIDGLWEIETQPRGDARGSLTRWFCEQEFAALGRTGLLFKQSNLSRTAQRGTVRGLHFQHAPALEAKLVRCIAGRVFDVVVDLRADSPSFLRWHGVVLDGSQERQIFIPEGCAHGFQTLSDDVQMLYQHSAPYSPEHEAGLRHDDPALAITWPLPITEVSARDRQHALIDPAHFSGVRLC